jgi:hypothetical protein
MGFGVRLGTTEATKPSTSASAERLKLTLMFYLNLLCPTVSSLPLYKIADQAESLQRRHAQNKLFARKNHPPQSLLNAQTQQPVNRLCPLIGGE